jgi:hypothetical protein
MICLSRWIVLDFIDVDKVHSYNVRSGLTPKFSCERLERKGATIVKRGRQEIRRVRNPMIIKRSSAATTGRPRRYHFIKSAYLSQESVAHVM